MRKIINKAITSFCGVSVIASSFCISQPVKTNADDDRTVVLRICNWEEYIDKGDWDVDEAIDLSDDNVIIGENSMIDDFTQWYYDTYGVNVEVEYSTFGTNEELYNQLNLGDVYDLVCPSEYLIMKLMVEDKLEKYDESFFDESNELNYYTKGVSPYIREQFENNSISGEKWADYAAGYMWGITGILYNPEEVTYEEASTWAILQNRKFNRQITVKDNVRDTYFAAMGIYKHDLLTDESFINLPDYRDRLRDEMNDVSKKTIDDVERILKDVKDNAYSFETDSGKSDMVTGKVVANYQWSGDAVYAMDQADDDDFYLEFAVPEEGTNLWFDGWVMLKDGIGDDADKKHAAQSFVNFMSRPDNVVRNMYYIGYTSVIAGGDDSTIFDYATWCYEAEDDEEDTIEYDVNYFFGGEGSDEYYITATSDAQRRQLFSQYPSEDVINRSAIMWYFDEEASVDINQMWINVRCFDINSVPGNVIIIGFICIFFIIVAVVGNIYKNRIIGVHSAK